MRLTAGGLVYCLYRSSCRNRETYVVKLQMILRRWTNGRHKLEPNRTIDGHKTVGTLWFAIFLQLFLILGVLHTLASDAIAMHRFQISVPTLCTKPSEEKDRREDLSLPEPERAVGLSVH